MLVINCFHANDELFHVSGLGLQGLLLVSLEFVLHTAYGTLEETVLAESRGIGNLSDNLKLE